MHICPTVILLMNSISSIICKAGDLRRWVKYPRVLKKKIPLSNTSVNIFIEASICLLVNKFKFENVFHYILLFSFTFK